MTPSERTMPTTTAVWMPGYGWVIQLPGGRERICVDRAEAKRVIDREASGSAVRWVDGPHADQSEGRAGTASASASGVVPATALDAGPSPAPIASEGSSGVSPLLLGLSLDAGPDPVSAGRGSELVENLGP